MKIVNLKDEEKKKCHFLHREKLLFNEADMFKVVMVNKVLTKWMAVAVIQGESKDCVRNCIHKYVFCIYNYMKKQSSNKTLVQPTIFFTWSTSPEEYNKSFYILSYFLVLYFTLGFSFRTRIWILFGVRCMIKWYVSWMEDNKHVWKRTCIIVTWFCYSMWAYKKKVLSPLIRRFSMNGKGSQQCHTDRKRKERKWNRYDILFSSAKRSCKEAYVLQTRFRRDRHTFTNSYSATETR